MVVIKPGMILGFNRIATAYSNGEVTAFIVPPSPVTTTITPVVKLLLQYPGGMPSRQREGSGNADMNAGFLLNQGEIVRAAARLHVLFRY